MKNITIKNVSTATVSIFVPGVFTRDLVPGRAIPITEEVYNDLTFDTGFMNLVDGHYIVIDGIQEEDQVNIVSDVFTKDDIGKMLDDLDVTAFAKFIPNATVAEKESVVNLAVEKGITHPGFVTLIKKYCDVDVISAINMKHQAEEK